MCYRSVRLDDKETEVNVSDKEVLDGVRGE